MAAIPGHDSRGHSAADATEIADAAAIVVDVQIADVVGTAVDVDDSSRGEAAVEARRAMAGINAAIRADTDTAMGMDTRHSAGHN